MIEGEIHSVTFTEDGTLLTVRVPVDTTWGPGRVQIVKIEPKPPKSDGPDAFRKATGR